jgi:hypothetical protein
MKQAALESEWQAGIRGLNALQAVKSDQFLFSRAVIGNGRQNFHTHRVAESGASKGSGQKRFIGE